MTRRTRIGDVAEQIRGVTFSKDEAIAHPAAGFVPVLRAGNIGENGLLLDDLIYVPAKRIHPKQYVRRDDVVVAVSSGSVDVVGKAARSLRNFDGAFGAFLKVLRPSTDIDPAYFAHFLRTPTYRRTVAALAAGANINNLRKEHLDQLEIPLPSISQQRRIAQLLDQVDVVRANRHQVERNWDELVSATFQHLFGDPVTNPHCWPTHSFGELMSAMQYGPRFYNASYSPEGIRIVRITDLARSGHLDFASMPRMAVTDDELRKHALSAGDIIFARTGATVGKLALIRQSDPPCIAGAYFIRIQLRACIEPTYAAAFLRSRSIQAIIEARSHQSAQQNFSGPGLRALPCPLPPIELQRQLGAYLTKVEENRALGARATDKVDELFASLQARAFSGQL